MYLEKDPKNQIAKLRLTETQSIYDLTVETRVEPRSQRWEARLLSHPDSSHHR